MAAPHVMLVGDRFSEEPGDGLIRILHIENGTFDFALIKQTLIQTGLTVSCHRVAAADELRPAPDSDKCGIRHFDLVIADDGIGIAPADIGRVMAPFVPGDSSTNLRCDGFGLSLPLVQRLTQQQHGGEMHLDSRIGVCTAQTICPPPERGMVGHDNTVPEILCCSRHAIVHQTISQ